MGANILFGHARAHREANGCTRLQTHGLANTRHGLTRVNYVTVSLESPPPIMTNHPFHWLSHLRGLLRQCQLRWGKRHLTDMESLNPASGFYFHVTGLLYFIMLFEDFVAGAAAEQSLSAATLIRLVDLFPFSSSFFFGSSGVILGEEGAGHITQFNLLTLHFYCFHTAGRSG